MATAVRSNWIPLPLTMLAPQAVAGVNVYLLKEEKDPVLYRTPETPFTKEDIAELQGNGITQVYIDGFCQERMQDNLRASLGQILDDPVCPMPARFSALSTVVKTTLREAFESGDLDESVSRSQEMAEHLVTFATDVEASDVIRILRHDFCTFTHSSNVACCAVLLAQEIGTTESDTLHEIAVGGMLHDLGKLQVPDAILNKPARLTDEEMAIVREHPTQGFRRLCRRSDLSAGQLMMVYQHHERIDGKGYPVGCLGAEIHPWARLCAVVDVYEALTGKRPYRKGEPPRQAIAIMERSRGTHFDEELFACWKQIIERR